MALPPLVYDPSTGAKRQLRSSDDLLVQGQGVGAALTALGGNVGWKPVAAWAAGVSYTAANPASSVTYGGQSYVCTGAHTSGSSFDPTKWILVAAQGAQGIPGGPALLGTRTALTGASILAAVASTGLMTSGYGSTGDGGHGLHLPIATPSTLQPWQWTSKDGQTWQLNETVTRPEQHGAFGCLSGSDFSIGANSNQLSRTGSAPFTAADVGKTVIVDGAGAAWNSSLASSPYLALVATINSVSGGVATLSANATTAVNNTTGVYGFQEHTQLINACNYLVSRGGGVLELGAKTYLFGATGGQNYGGLPLPPGVTIRGQGKDISIIRCVGTGHRVINQWNTSGGAQAPTGVGGLRDLTIWGSGDQAAAPGTEADRACIIGPFKTTLALNVAVIHSGYISLTLYGEVTRAEGCYIRYSRRDGIQLWGSKSRVGVNNDIRYCGDDGIACHISSGSTPVVADSQVVLVGNTLQFCTGMKILGARNAILALNKTRFVYGYAVNLGYDASSVEGYNTMVSVQIVDNVFTDTIGELPISGGSGLAAVYINGARSLGSGAYAVPVFPGQYNPGASKFLTPGAAFLQLDGTSIPQGAAEDIRITGNIIRQTLEPPYGQTAPTTFSGFAVSADTLVGAYAWWTGGPVDPALTSLIALQGAPLLHGIQFASGAFDGVDISQNVIEGISAALLVSGFDVIYRLRFKRNLVRRVTCGPDVQSTIALNGSVVRHVDVEISDNDLDIDPYCEASLRTTPIDGTWTAPTGSNYYGINFTNVIGPRVERNVFRNCVLPINKAAGDIIAAKDNVYVFDWSGASLAGIGTINFESGARSVFQYSNPASAFYGTYSTTTDSDFVVQAGSATMPTSGYYRAGQYVKVPGAPVVNSDSSYTRGWLRLTTGNTHVLGTDWKADISAAAVTQTVNDVLASRELIRLDFQRQMYAADTGPFQSSLATVSGWTYSRTGAANGIDNNGNPVAAASGAPQISNRGLLIEQATTNLLTNPSAPATQAASLAAGTYTLSCIGSGSVSLSGGATGTALQGAPVTFTLASATTVTFTCSGTLAWIQCEALGFATSPVSGTRNAPSTKLTGVTLPLAYTIYFEAEMSEVAYNSASGAQYCPLAMGDGTSGNAIYFLRQDNVGYDFVIVSGGSTVLNTSVQLSSAGLIRVAARIQTANMRHCINGVLGGLTSAGTPPAISNGQIALGQLSWAASRYMDGWMRRLAIYSTALSDSQMQTLTAT